MITEQEKDAALTVLADYIAQNDINMVGGVFENDVMGEFVVTYGRESALQNMSRDKAELVEALKAVAIQFDFDTNNEYEYLIIKEARALLERHKCD